MAQKKPRARDLGIPFDGHPGPLNAITDVPAVEVGYTTIVSGEGKLEVGFGPIRTGVTAILPRGRQSSDIFVAFSTANPGSANPDNGMAQLQMVSNGRISALFAATMLATEEAIVNAMAAAETMTGRDGRTVYTIPPKRLQDTLRKYNRLQEIIPGAAH